jgi:hypothetical protein
MSVNTLVLYFNGLSFDEQVYIEMYQFYNLGTYNSLWEKDDEDILLGVIRGFFVDFRIDAYDDYDNIFELWGDGFKNRPLLTVTVILALPPIELDPRKPLSPEINLYLNYGTDDCTDLKYFREENSLGNYFVFS